VSLWPIVIVKLGQVRHVDHQRTVLPGAHSRSSAIGHIIGAVHQIVEIGLAAGRHRREGQRHLAVVQQRLVIPLFVIDPSNGKWAGPMPD